MPLIAGIPVVSWIVEKGECLVPGSGVTALGWVKDGKIVAGVMYEEFTEASIHATIVLEEGTTIGKELLFTMFDYPFRQLGVKKIIVQMSSANIPSAHLAQRLGFELEAQIKDAYLDGDRLIYTMPVDKCKWLTRHENEESKDTESA